MVIITRPTTDCGPWYWKSLILLTLTDSADITAAFARAVCNVYNSPKQTQGVGYEASGRLEPGVRVILCSVTCTLSFDKRTTPQPQCEAKVRRNYYKGTF